MQSLAECRSLKHLFCDNIILYTDPRVVYETMWNTTTEDLAKYAKYVNNINVCDQFSGANLLHSACESGDGFIFLICFVYV